MNQAEDQKKKILVLGPTGVGKSSLIAAATGQLGLVGHTLKSCTQEIQSFNFPFKGENISLIDTLGFGDSEVSDIRILCDLKDYLYGKDRKPANIHGVIFLHSVKESRFTATAKANLRLLKALCGEDLYQHVVFATTMWDDLPQEKTDKFEDRHEKLTQEYWRELVEKGVRIAKFLGTRDSVFEMVSMLVVDNETAPPPLQLQTEMKEYGSLHLTAAGKVVSEKGVESATKLRKQIAEEDWEGQAELDELIDGLANVENELGLLRTGAEYEPQRCKPDALSPRSGLPIS